MKKNQIFCIHKRIQKSKVGKVKICHDKDIQILLEEYLHNTYINNN